MRKLFAVFSVVSVFFMFTTTTFASDLTKRDDKSTFISTVVPSFHRITVIVIGDADVTLNGESGKDHVVERMSRPELIAHAKSGSVITKMCIDEKDVTDNLLNGKYILSPVYKDEVIIIQAEINNQEQSDKSMSDITESDFSSHSDSTKTGETAPISVLFLVIVFSGMVIIVLTNNRKMDSK